ncbi:hypothetical protein FRZ61_08400 [Hypericibacter adhaerens]|uniref:Uncharacterized protein n=1 Tax=Hypericibacter adhaerens TaxID=2602016 RepID=A0A5J6MXH1_9PROT|nr:hypothetical protein FRZ61_08400 [Hypericibacter adhaerens]
MQAFDVAREKLAHQLAAGGITVDDDDAFAVVRAHGSGSISCRPEPERTGAAVAMEPLWGRPAAAAYRGLQADLSSFAILPAQARG